MNWEFKNNKEIPDFEVKDEPEKKSLLSTLGEFIFKGVFMKRLEIKFTWKF